MTVNVRAARITDASGLADLAKVTFPLACPPGSAPEAIADYIAGNLSEGKFTEYLGDDARSILVAEDEGELCGYTMLVGGEPRDADVAAALSIRPTIELSKVYVLAGSHGRGVSAPLMAGTLDEARVRGAVGIWLGVNQLNGRAQRFYEKSGFRVVGEKTFALGPETHHDFTMERAL